MNSHFKTYLLEHTQSTDCRETEIIQSLWSGYGKISRYQLMGSEHASVVIKHISLPEHTSHPRGWNSAYGHQCKVRSYEVETYWYQQWNQLCAVQSKTPTFLGSYAAGTNQWIILEDLDHEFPLRKHRVNLAEIKLCLAWLAHFHACFLDCKPEGLWEIGTYWNLDTRPDEYDVMEETALKKKAYQIDSLLNDCRFQTIVHGDAKLANFCFSADLQKVAAVDFQYVGGGCGMKDVAYFLGSCLSSAECTRLEEELLASYFSELASALLSKITPETYEALEKEWRIMYPVACADFTRFMLGWMPTHRKINPYQMGKITQVLAKF